MSAGAAVIVAAQIGAWLMRHHLRPGWIRRAFGVLLLSVAVKLAWPVF